MSGVWVTYDAVTNEVRTIRVSADPHTPPLEAQPGQRVMKVSLPFYRQFRSDEDFLRAVGLVK